MEWPDVRAGWLISDNKDKEAVFHAKINFMELYDQLE